MMTYLLCDWFLVVVGINSEIFIVRFPFNKKELLWTNSVGNQSNKVQELKV